MTAVRAGSLAGEERAKVAAQLRKEYEAGASLYQLADRWNRSYGWVHRMLAEAGTTMRPRGYAGRVARAQASGCEA